MIKKLLISILTGLIFLFSFAPNLAVHAQTTSTTTTNSTTWYNQTFFDWYGKVYDVNNPNEIFGERYTAAQVQWIIYGVWGFLINSVTGPQNAGLVQCFLNNYTDITTCTDQLKKLISSTGYSTEVLAANTSQDQSLWSLVFATDRPISAISYIKEKIDNFKLVPVAHAQTLGFGFGALRPIQDMWVAARNASFGLFVIAAVIFAFMIMFRVKINPQTVISVQSAIPKLVTALILVTFSYAIAGFLIDLMYLVIGILSVMLASFVPIVSLKPIWVFNFLTLGQPLGAIQITIIGFLTILTLPFWIGVLALTTILIAIPIATGGLGIVFWILLIPLIIVVLIMVWFCIKIIWALFKAFAFVLLLTIFAPLQIALGVLIPNFGFSQWVRSYLSHLAVFVTTGVIGFLSLLFTIQGIYIGFQNVPGGTTFAGELLKSYLGVVAGVPPWTISTSPWPPLLGAGNGIWVGILFLGVSFVIFTLIPKTTEIIQGFISGKPFAYGTAIGEAFGPVVAGGILGGNIISSKQAAAYEKQRSSPGGTTSIQDIVNGVLNGLGAVSGGKIKRPQ
jgi:hypothetical protein